MIWQCALLHTGHEKSEENLDSLTLCFLFTLSIFTVRRRQEQVGSVEFNSMPDKRAAKLLVTIV